MFEIPNNSISYKKMGRMTKQDLVDSILEIKPDEVINDFNYKKIVLMDILNYHLNRR